MADEELKRFNEWRAKSTEFTRERLFSKVRRIMSEYECDEVPTDNPDEIKFKGKTVEKEAWIYPDEGIKREIVRFRCNYSGTATYRDDFCSIGFSVNGPHETHFGGTSPCKTEEDIQDERIEWAMAVRELVRIPLPKYRQMTIFECL